MQASIESIKVLREQTSAGIMDCKKALEQANGDLEKAQEILKEKGIASASKRAAMAVNQGVIGSYVHKGGRIGALVELNCETDFVARTPGFTELAHDLAMQVAAMAPLYLDDSDIPEGEQINPQEACLLQQSFIKDPTQTVEDLVNVSVGRLGENVRVRRFARFALGE